MKKIIALLLCVVMSFGIFAGCDEDKPAGNTANEISNEAAPSASGLSVAEIIDKSIDAFGKIKSCSVYAETENVISVGNNKIATKMVVNTDVDLEAKMQYAKMVTEQSGSKVETQTYVDASSDNVSVYLLQNGTWVKQTSGLPVNRAEELGLYPKNDELMMLYLEQCKLNSEMTEQTVDGKECYVFDVKIDGSQFEIIKKSTLKDTLNALLKTGMTEDELNDLIAKMGEFKYTISIDKSTFLPVTLDADMTDAMNGFMKELMKRSGVKEEITVSDVVLVSKYSRYDQVEEIVIPSEALNGREATMYN